MNNTKSIEEVLASIEGFPDNLLSTINCSTDIAVAVINARKDMKLTQKQLSIRCGVKQPFISRIEQGNTNVRLGTILKVIHSLGCKMEISKCIE